MPTIIVCSLPGLMIEIRKKLKSQQRTKCAENLHKHAHAAMQFFQPMPLNSKPLHKKVRFKWTFLLSDKQK